MMAYLKFLSSVIISAKISNSQQILQHLIQTCSYSKLAKIKGIPILKESLAIHGFF